MDTESITSCFTDCFSNGNDNVIDAMDNVACYVEAVANALSPIGAIAGDDATGGRVNSVTEALMGCTAGLCRIASAIELLATVVQDMQGDAK